MPTLRNSEPQWFLFLVILWFLFVGTGCQTSPPAGNGLPHVVKRSQFLMGTVVFVTAVANDEDTAKDATTKSLNEIRRLEELLSTWIPTSELSRVNAAAGGQAIAVSPETFEIIRQSLEMMRVTEGGFNIAVGPAVALWNASGEGHLPSQAELDAVRPRIDVTQIYLDEQTRSIRLGLSEMQIDVGGIGKG